MAKKQVNPTRMELTRLKRKLDMADQAGQDLVRKFAAKCDIVIEKVGTLRNTIVDE